MPCCSRALVSANTFRTSSSTMRIRLPAKPWSPWPGCLRSPLGRAGAADVGAVQEQRDVVDQLVQRRRPTTVIDRAYWFSRVSSRADSVSLRLTTTGSVPQLLARAHPLEHLEAAAPRERQVDQHTVEGPASRAAIASSARRRRLHLHLVERPRTARPPRTSGCPRRPPRPAGDRWPRSMKASRCSRAASTFALVNGTSITSSAPGSRLMCGLAAAGMCAATIGTSRVRGQPLEQRGAARCRRARHVHPHQHPGGLPLVGDASAPSAYGVARTLNPWRRPTSTAARHRSGPTARRAGPGRRVDSPVVVLHLLLGSLGRGASLRRETRLAAGRRRRRGAPPRPPA